MNILSSENLNNIIPFVNRYEKNNLIYALINTSDDEELVLNEKENKE